MRGFVGVAVVCVTVMTGCPSEYGREGRIAEAVLKDETENSAVRCSQAEIEKACANGKQNTRACQDCFK